MIQSLLAFKFKRLWLSTQKKINKRETLLGGKKAQSPHD